MISIGFGLNNLQRLATQVENGSKRQSGIKVVVTYSIDIFVFGGGKCEKNHSVMQKFTAWKNFDLFVFVGEIIYNLFHIIECIRTHLNFHNHLLFFCLFQQQSVQMKLQTHEFLI